MKIHRITGMVLRSLFAFRRSYDRLSDTFYWPLIDLFVWGLTSSYFISTTHSTTNFIVPIISGLLLWIIVWRGQYEISVGLLSELWDRNLINIFISPVTFSEWLTSFVIIGLVKGLASIIFAAIVAFLLYHVNLLYFGLYLFPFFVLLFLNGWWIGFLVSGFIVRFGTKIQTLAWTVAGLAIPFSGVFYPISVLPVWAQKVSLLIPTSYIFENAREFLQKGTITLSTLALSLGMSILYVILAILFMRKSMDRILQKGLVNLE